jgi:hypothetical protein
MCDVWTVSSWQERSFFASQASRSPSQPFTSRRLSGATSFTPPTRRIACNARPSHRRDLVGKRAATLARRPANNAVGRCLVPWITRTQDDDRMKCPRGKQPAHGRPPFVDLSNSQKAAMNAAA